jgi:hypothetical protein
MRQIHSAIHRLQEGYDSVRREVLYNILIDFEVPMKLVKRGLKLNGTHQLLSYADDVNVLGIDIDTKKKKTYKLLLMLVRRLV